jgi:hypothetical protein
MAMTHRADETVDSLTNEPEQTVDSGGDSYEEAAPFGAAEGASHGDSHEATVGDAPNPTERGRSEEPLPDGVGYDGSPVDQIQAERAERLAPENRPENSEVDNSGRIFDEEKAMFTDEPGYEDAPKKFPPASEQGA